MLLLAIVLGTVAVAIGVDAAALLAWLLRRSLR
jgi:hypothetical protein